MLNEMNEVIYRPLTESERTEVERLRPEQKELAGMNEDKRRLELAQEVHSWRFGLPADEADLESDFEFSR